MVEKVLYRPGIRKFHIPVIVPRRGFTQPRLKHLVADHLHGHGEVE